MTWRMLLFLSASQEAVWVPCPCRLCFLIGFLAQLQHSDLSSLCVFQAGQLRVEGNLVITCSLSAACMRKLG